MRFKIQPVLLGILTAVASPLAVQADTLEEAFASGKATLDVRLRYEAVDDGNTATKDADAYTMRTRLGYTTGSYNGITAHADYVVVHTGGDFGGDFAGVADPKIEELNQAWFAYSGIENNTFKLGRQRVILDNARFVGNVGWRQNEQTYDALAYINTSLADTTILLANVQQVNSIFGTSINTSTNLLNVAFDKTPVGKVTAYAYTIDLDDSAALDSMTLGARVKGSMDNLLYTVELAQQSDYADNTDFSANYSLLELGYKMDDITFSIANETLGSDDGTAAVQTLLATKHAFNGWADKFLTTPAAGLNDMYIKVATKVAGVKVAAVYHDFSADEGNADYGTELDLVASKSIGKNMKAMLKYADYSADDFSTDTQKIWLSLDAKFAQ